MLHTDFRVQWLALGLVSICAATPATIPSHESREPAARANQIRDLLVTALDPIRETFEPLSQDEQVAQARGSGGATALNRLRPQMPRCVPSPTSTRCRPTVSTPCGPGSTNSPPTQANPTLRHAVGIGVDVASVLLVAAGDNPERLTTDAGFAALSGASLVEASSGK